MHMHLPNSFFFFFWSAAVAADGGGVPLLNLIIILIQGVSDGSGEVLETELIWWISFCNLVGSIQYFVSSFMGFFRDLPGFGFQLEEVELFLGYTLGSAVLALGSYLMVIELINTQPEIFQVCAGAILQYKQRPKTCS